MTAFLWVLAGLGIGAGILAFLGIAVCIGATRLRRMQDEEEFPSRHG